MNWPMTLGPIILALGVGLMAAVLRISAAVRDALKEPKILEPENQDILPGPRNAPNW